MSCCIFLVMQIGIAAPDSGLLLRANGLMHRGQIRESANKLFENRKQSTMANLVLGGSSGTVAATICYPLDTIRRRMQMAGHMYSSQIDAFCKIWRQVGW